MKLRTGGVGNHDNHKTHILSSNNITEGSQDPARTPPPISSLRGALRRALAVPALLRGPPSPSIGPP